MCVSLSCQFPGILTGFSVGSGSGSLGFGPIAKQAFSCLIAFGHPSPAVGRQVGKTNTLALSLGIPPRIFGASTEIGHLGAERPGAYSAVGSIITEGVYGRRRQGLDHTQPEHLQGVLHNHIDIITLKEQQNVCVSVLA